MYVEKSAIADFWIYTYEKENPVWTDPLGIWFIKINKINRKDVDITLRFPNHNRCYPQNQMGLEIPRDTKELS